MRCHFIILRSSLIFCHVFIVSDLVSASWITPCMTEWETNPGSFTLTRLSSAKWKPRSTFLKSLLQKQTNITLPLPKLLKSFGYEMSDWNAEGVWRPKPLSGVWETSLCKYIHAILQPVNIHVLYLQLLLLLLRNWILRGKAQVLNHQLETVFHHLLFWFAFVEAL